jgi:hypothetical protein
MMIQKSKILPVFAGLVLVLQGCASQMNPVGETKFDCNRRQDSKSVYCRSFKAVEASTSGEIPPSRYDKEYKQSEFDRMTGIAPDDDGSSTPSQSNKASKPALLPHQFRQEAPLVGAPVREGPVIQRVWIKRFVDGRDLLTENTVVYKEIRGTRWAGFDEGQNALTLNPKAYPHKPTEPQPITAANGQTNSPDSRQSGAPDFSQPTSNGDVDETANSPAESGPMTMPK